MWSCKVKYNPVTSNCQHFAVDLFAFLALVSYLEAVQLAVDSMDKGCDRRKYKAKEPQQQNMTSDVDDEKALDVLHAEPPQDQLKLFVKQGSDLL